MFFDNMEVSVKVSFMLMIFLYSVNGGEGRCELDINKNIGNPPPVLIQNGGFLTVNTHGNISLARGKKFSVACPGEGNHLILGGNKTDFGVLEVRCKSNTTFAVGRWDGPFNNITCNVQPQVSSELAGECYGGNTLYKVGYKVASQFYALYEACFDENTLSTSYVKHYILPTTKHIQYGRRPSFFVGGLFGKVNMAKLYNNKNQRDRLNALLGEGMDQKYITKNNFLSRGHLSPRADHSLSTVQRASFHYVNSAPQWMRVNAGDWAALESALRSRAQTLNTTLEAYTGTLGVMTLEDSRGKETAIYLTNDGNNNPIVPVPLYFFKVIYEPNSKTALSFVTINSPFYNSTMTDRLTFCDDVCGDNQLTWLKWRADNAHSFCCTYQDFAPYVEFLPKLDVEGDFS